MPRTASPPSEGNRPGSPATVTSLLPALAAIGTLLALIATSLALVGASDVPSLTRGSPLPTFLGAILLVLAVITAGLGAVFPHARRWLILGGYVAAAGGLGCYLMAAVEVTSDPVAPRITISPIPDTEETKVVVGVSGLSYDERLQVSASYADEDNAFMRTVIGAGADGRIDFDFVVPAQSASRRLQVTAGVLDRKSIRRAFECNDPTAGRTCAEAAATIPRGIPEVQARLRGRRLELAVLDKRRIPGVLAVRVTQGGEEIFSTRTRVSGTVYRTSRPIAPSRGSKREVFCVAAAYGPKPPACDKDDETVAIMRLYRPAAGRAA